MLFDPIAMNAPYRMLMIASVTTTGVAQREASGNSSRQNRIIPKVPTLSSTLTSSTEVPGVAFSAVSGSQVCTGNIGALIAKAMKNPMNIQRPATVPKSIWDSSESRYVGPPFVLADST